MVRRKDGSFLARLFRLELGRMGDKISIAARREGIVRFILSQPWLALGLSSAPLMIQIQFHR